MLLKILGSSGSECPGNHSPAYLVDSSLLLDAGTIGAVLDLDDQKKIRNVLISHSHLDHIKGLPFLADNIASSSTDCSICVISIPEVIESIRKHLFNKIIWPDFSTIPSRESAVMTYMEIQPGVEFEIGGYSVTSFPVNHSVPAVGFFVKKGKSALLYTGDTGPTERIWQEAGNSSAMIVEVSFPDQMEELALITGHLTPSLLSHEFKKLDTLPPLILVTHPKPQFRDMIFSQLRQLPFPGLTLMSDGDEYNI